MLPFLNPGIKLTHHDFKGWTTNSLKLYKRFWLAKLPTSHFCETFRDRENSTIFSRFYVKKHDLTGQLSMTSATIPSLKLRYGYALWESAPCYECWALHICYLIVYHTNPVQCMLRSYELVRLLPKPSRNCAKFQMDGMTAGNTNGRLAKDATTAHVHC